MNFLLKLWRELFPKYQLVKVFTGRWLNKEQIPYSHCWYEVWVSETHPKQIKLKIGGNSPKEHPMYGEVVYYIVELRNSENGVENG